MLISECLENGLDGLPPVGGADDLHLLVFEQRGQRKDVAGVVVDHQHLAPAQHLVGTVQALAARCIRSGRSATTRCRNSAVSSSRRSGERTSLSTMLLASVRSCCCSASLRSLPVNTTTGTSRQRRLGVDLLQQLEAAHVGQAQVQHHAVEGLRAHRGERLAAGVHGHDLDVLVARAAPRSPAARSVVLDDQQPLGARRGEFLDAVERVLAARPRSPP